MSGYFERLESHLLDAVERKAYGRAGRGRSASSAFAAWRRRARGRGGRWRPLAVTVAVVLAGGGGAFAAGWFSLGSPAGSDKGVNATADDGVALRGGVQLLAISVPDPQGGPPWGLKLDRTTRGLTCLQVGRRDHGTVGVLGIDGAFDNDRRFHPLVLNAPDTPSTECSTNDGDGHAFLAGMLQGTPAAGPIYFVCRGLAPSLYAQLPGGPNGPTARIWRRVAEHQPGRVCPPSELRDVYFGLLGPRARSITYPGPLGHAVTERTVGADGAYLVLAPPTEAVCNLTGCAAGNINPGVGLAPGFITSVAYTNGTTCRTATLATNEATAIARLRQEFDKRFPAVAALQRRLLREHRRPNARQRAELEAYAKAFDAQRSTIVNQASCPLLGYVPRRVKPVTHAQVAEQLSIVVDERVRHQAATFSSVVVVSSSVTFTPSLNFMPSSTSPTSSWPLNRRHRSWAASKSL